MTTQYVIWLSEIGDIPLSLVGGKAANLGALARQKFPTVDGFCVTTEAYRRFLSSDGLEFGVADVLGEIDIDDSRETKFASEKIRNMIVSADLQSEIAQDIVSAYKRLELISVAVRSSATAEDLPEASFAGQQDSYLNVTGIDQVLLHIKYCWASLWTPRAIQYRVYHNVDHNSVRMAVIVQEMVKAEVAGVMFTANPITGHSGQIVISSSYGLGEAVVQGNIEPDNFILEKNSLAIVERKIATKQVMLASNEVSTGTKETPVPLERQQAASLSDSELLMLGTLGKHVERLFGTAQDIEWALSGEKIFLLQARPVTSGKVKAFPQYSRIKRFFLSFMLEYFPIPFFHFDRSALISLVRVTLDLFSVFGLNPPKAEEVIRLASDGSLALVPILPEITWRTLPFAMLGSVRALRSLRVSPSIWVRERWPEISQRLEILQQQNTQTMTDQELIDLIDECISIRDERIFCTRLDYFLGGWIVMGLLPVILKLVGGNKQKDLYYNLTTGLDHPTASINTELRELSRRALSLSNVKDILQSGVSKTTWLELEKTDKGARFLELVSSFLRRFGGRTEMLIPFPSAPSWDDNPRIVLSLVAALLGNPESLRRDLAKEQKQRYVEARSQVLTSCRWVPGLSRLMNFLIERNRAMLTERDWIIFAYEQATRPIRRSMVEIGERLYQRRILPQSSDIRFLTLNEAHSLLTGTPTDERSAQMHLEVKQRKLARPKTLANWRMVSSVQRKTVGKVFLKGLAVSPGVATGRARVILSDANFNELESGEILVCRATNPAWTPLFAIAAAVVADSGGPLSHAAIVAREYGIPAVLNTKDATRVMIEGETYIVDGTQGLVKTSSG